MTPEAYVSAEVVAKYLDIEKRQVLALARQGKLPAHPLDSNASRKLWRFKLSEIDAAITINGLPRALPKVPMQSNNHSGSPQSQRG